MPADEELAVRLEFFGDEIERITLIDPLTGEILNEVDEYDIYPGKHFITPEEEFADALKDIRTELDTQLELFRGEGKLLEAERLEQRTLFDLEMMHETGTCRVSRTILGLLAGGRRVRRLGRYSTTSLKITCCSSMNRT